MSIDFDYKGFANNLTKQAEHNIPKDIALNHKREFLDRIYSFTYIAGEAFSKDETIQDSDMTREANLGKLTQDEMLTLVEA